MTDCLLITSTTETKQEAQRITRALVERRLGACAQIIGPIESIYWWQGKVESAEEWLCFIKTQATHFDAVEACIKELHSYSTPQIVAMPIAAGSQDYLGWLRSEAPVSE